MLPPWRCWCPACRKRSCWSSLRRFDSRRACRGAAHRQLQVTRHRGDDAMPDRAGRPGETREGRSTVDRLGREAAMRYEWGRAPEAGRWQRAVPVWLMSVMLVAVASGGGMWWVRQTFFWTPLQQFYLSAYVRSALASSLALRTGRYRLLLMENRRGTRLAIDD